MQYSDLSQVIAIEQHSFEEPYTPWSTADFVQCMDNRNMHLRVAETGGMIVGYVVYALEKGQLSVMNLAVRPQVTRYGVGSFMLNDLKHRLNRRRQRVEMYVRETNVATHLFCKENDFLCVGLEPGYYSDTREPAYLFMYQVPLDDLYGPIDAPTRKSLNVP